MLRENGYGDLLGAAGFRSRERGEERRDPLSTLSRFLPVRTPGAEDPEHLHFSY